MQPLAKQLKNYLERLKRKKRPFLSFQIEPTSRCQLKCVMCPKAVFSDEWEAGDMSLAVYKRISECFHLASNIHLQGWGEPLLHPGLPTMIQMARAKNCRVSLTTNGAMLSPRVSEMLIREGVDNIIAVSIAGASRDTHESLRCGSDFDSLINNIKILSDLKKRLQAKVPKTTVSFLMTKANIHELPEAVGLAKRLGINELVATNLDYTPTKTH